MGRLAELIATSPLAALIASIVGLAIVLAEWIYALRKYRSYGAEGLKGEVDRQAELATTKTGYVPALYSLLGIAITFNFILSMSFLAKRGAMADSGAVRDWIAPAVSTGSFAYALLLLFFAIRINLAILRMSRDDEH